MLSPPGKKKQKPLAIAFFGYKLLQETGFPPQISSRRENLKGIANRTFPN